MSRVLQLGAGASWRPSRSTPTSPGSRPTTIDPFERRRGRADRPAGRAVRAAARRRRRRPRRRARCSRCWRTSSTPTPPAPSPRSSGSGSHPSSPRSTSTAPRARSPRCARWRPPAGRGWEYLTGTGWDFDAELAELPELLREHVKAPSVEAGRYDLVIDPSNLWLTIHESIGHATELDRALGYEAAYAGTVFATLDKLGTLQLRQPGHERHRRPHRRARPGHDRLRRRGRRDPAVRHRPGRRARRLPAQPADGARQRAAARHRALQRLRVRRLARPHPACSGWRTCRCSRRRTARRPRS